MNSQSLFTDSSNEKKLKEVSLKINDLRTIFDDHVISMTSDFDNIFNSYDGYDGYDGDEITADTIINNVINSISDKDNNDSIYDKDITVSISDMNNSISDYEQSFTETSEKNSFSIEMNITPDISNFLNTETETESQTPICMSESVKYPINKLNNIKKYKIVKNL